MRTIGGLLALLFGALISALLVPVRLFPRATQRSGDALANAPLRGFGIGLLTLAGMFLVALPLLFSSGGSGQILSLLLWFSASVAWLMGMGGLTREATRRLFRKQYKIAGAAMTKSGLMLAAAAGIPVLGWFILAPLAGITALGAGGTALWWKRPERREGSLHSNHNGLCLR